MANLTVTIDDDLLRRARIRALEQGTSVNGLVRDWLERFADEHQERDATESIIALGRKGHASSGPGGRRWTREDAYEDRLNRHGR